MMTRLTARRRPDPTIGSTRGTVFYRRWPLDGPLWAFHAAIDALAADTVPEGYWRKVQASRAQQRASHRGRGGGQR